MNTKKHWTDDFIAEREVGKFYAYNKEGVLHGVFTNKNDAKQSLIEYKSILNQCTTCG